MDLIDSRWKVQIAQLVSLKSFNTTVTKGLPVVAPTYEDLRVGLHRTSLHSASLKTLISRSRNKTFAMTSFIDQRMTVHSVLKTMKKAKYLLTRISKADFTTTLTQRQILKNSKVINQVLFLVILRLITLMQRWQPGTIRSRQLLDLQQLRTKLIISMRQMMRKAVDLSLLQLGLVQI